MPNKSPKEECNCEDRPMTEGEAELAKGLDEAFSKEEKKCCSKLKEELVEEIGKMKQEIGMFGDRDKEHYVKISYNQAIESIIKLIQNKE